MMDEYQWVKQRVAGYGFLLSVYWMTVGGGQLTVDGGLCLGRRMGDASG